MVSEICMSCVSHQLCPQSQVLRRSQLCPLISIFLLARTVLTPGALGCFFLLYLLLSPAHPGLIFLTVPSQAELSRAEAGSKGLGYQPRLSLKPLATSLNHSYTADV